MKNLKDKITTIAGVIFAICTILTTGATGVSMPTWAITLSGVLMAISGGVIAFFTGRNPNGTKKTAEQMKQP